MTDGIMDIIKNFLNGVGVFFVLYLIGYSTFLFLAVVVGSSELYRRRRQEKLKNTLQRDYYIPISIIVPAYNEEVTVVETVRSLLSLDYRAYEIIVVDDGSKDATSAKLIEAFDMHLIRRAIRRQIQCQPEEFVYESADQKVSLTLIRKKNGGKADSLNMGINAARFPYFICMDADSVLQYDSLQKIARPVLEDDRVVAVGGTIRPSNDVTLENGRVKRYQLPNNILACMQVLEYDRSFLASRILFDKFNGSLIISGAFGLFKKETVIAAGGYDHSTMGEDMELVVKLHEYCVVHEIPYSIRYATDAICWTQAPERLQDLCKQRKRWHLGLFQSMWKHKSLFFNLKYGAVSFISYLYFLLYELLSPFIEIFGIFTMILAFAVDLINIPFMILFFLIYAVFSSILSLTAFFARIQTIDLKISLPDVLKAILLCFFEVSCLRFVLAFVRMTAFIGYRKKKLQWGRIERKKIDLTCLLVTLLFLSAVFPVSAEVRCSEEPAGDADSVYVAGNPDFYPVEHYNSKTGCYEGLMPDLLQYISENTGLDFTYISAGEENSQARLARNRQVEMVTACLLPDSELEPYLFGERIIFSFSKDGEEQNVCLAFTEIASEELIHTVTAGIDELPDSMLTGITVSYVMGQQHKAGHPWVLWLMLAFLVLMTAAVIWLCLRLRTQKKLHQQDKLIDPITGIGNSAYFSQYFKNFISDQSRSLYYVAYLAFDIKHTNKFFGEEEAENVLRYAADILSKNAADTDIFARVTGGGFGIAFQSGNRAGAQERVEQLLHLLNQYSKAFKRDHSILFRAGLYSLKQGDHSSETALYYAQQGYRYAAEHRLSLFFSDVTSHRGADEMAERQKEITSALKKREFKLYLQFIVDKNTKEIYGAEALSRWQHPQKGLLSPAHYVGVMEELGNISELDFYIFEETCRQLQNWQNSKFRNLSLSCNFTRETISFENFMERLNGIAEKFQFDHSRLIIEITEDMEESNETAAFQNIKECKNAGYRIALDDMGDGYTSFLNLCEYPLDFMKIDKRVLGKAETQSGHALLNGMIALAHSMEIDVICEGVETTQQNELINRTACDFVQGFYYSRAIPLEAVEDFLQKYSVNHA